MDRVLITGAGGFLGSRFVELFRGRYEVIGITHKELDITEEDETIKTIKSYKPKYVVHAAAIADTGLCERNPELSYKVNVTGSVNVAKGCLNSKAKLIYLSSDQVYVGNSEAGPYSEDCVPVPDNVYGKDKLEAERAVLGMSGDSIVLRLTWLFGLPERKKKTNSNIVWNIVRTAMKNEALKLPANEFRGITYIYDMLEAFDGIFQLPGGLYNAGSENNLSTYDIAEIVLKEMGLQGRKQELLIKDTERYKLHNRDLRISNEKLKRHNIHFPETEEAVKKCIKDFLYTV